MAILVALTLAPAWSFYIYALFRFWREAMQLRNSRIQAAGAIVPLPGTAVRGPRVDPESRVLAMKQSASKHSTERSAA